MSAPMKTLRTAALAAFALCLPVLASAHLTRSDDAAVGFTASGPGGLRINGQTADLTLLDDGATVSVVVPLGNLVTGITLRDRHMRNKYLQVAQYPEAVLRVRRSDLTLPVAGDRYEGDARGTLSVHGQSHGVVFHYGVKHDGPFFNVAGSFHMNMNDFGVEVPSYLGVTVKPDVDVTARFNAKDDP